MYLWDRAFEVDSWLGLFDEFEALGEFFDSECLRDLFLLGPSATKRLSRNLISSCSNFMHTNSPARTMTSAMTALTTTQRKWK